MVKAIIVGKAVKFCATLKYVFCFAEILREAGNVRQRLRHLGRRESRVVVQDVDVRGHPGDRAVFPRRSHLQEALALQVAQRRERAAEEFRSFGRSVVGRVRQVLLPEDRQRQRRLRGYQLEEGAAREPRLQELQVVPGHHLPRTVHPRRGRGQRRGIRVVACSRLV
jgi:hypothetical protein